MRLFKTFVTISFFILLVAPTSSAIQWIGLWRVKNISVNSTLNQPVKNLQASVEGHDSKGVQGGLGCGAARKEGYLKGRQVKLCHKHREVMPFVAIAALATLRVCQHRFRNRRWNCTNLNHAPKFAKDLASGTREQSFAYSLSSAALARETAVACSGGWLLACGCGRVTKQPPVGAFKWGGCNDNLEWGTRFARNFADSPFKTKGNRNQVLSMVNRHNNKAGRKILQDSLSTQCKCHGVSGSCNVKTCWRALPPLAEIGERLERKYQSAIEVALASESASALPHKLVPVNVQLKTQLPQDQLVFNAKSPDYCYRDPEFGSFGTYARSCNASSSGSAGCDSMCCGRGYKTHTVQKLERCHCKYHWCCYVKCKTCKRWIEISTCN